MTTACTDRDHPYYKQLSKMYSKKVSSFFMRNKNRMKYVSLGEALDFASFGGANYVVWDMGKNALVNFIYTWMDSQKPHYFWNRPGDNHIEKLPYINYDKCPADEKHEGVIMDLGGRLRCSHSETEKLKPSFIDTYNLSDRHSGMKKKDFSQISPDEPIFDDEDYDEKGMLFPWEQERADKYDAEMEKFENEEPTLEIRNACYSIISDKGTSLSLEQVLRRLDVAHTFTNQESYCVYPFSGFILANYVRAWHNQKGRKRFFMKPGQRDDYVAFPKFVPVNSDD